MLMRSLSSGLRFGASVNNTSTDKTTKKVKLTQKKQQFPTQIVTFGISLGPNLNFSQTSGGFIVLFCFLGGGVLTLKC